MYTSNRCHRCGHVSVSESASWDAGFVRNCPQCGTRMSRDSKVERVLITFAAITIFVGLLIALVVEGCSGAV